MKEEEIRPAKIFEKYLSLTKEDTFTYFDKSKKEDSNCPGCDTKGKPSFVKHGFAYELCPNCYTLFVNPRPVSEAFSKYYTESPSSKFWASTFYKETADARRIKIWKPRAKKIKEILERYAKNSQDIIDIGGGFGLFAEEIKDLTGQTPIIIEPSPNLAEVCRKKKFPVIQKFLEEVRIEDLPMTSKTFISFELFEHLHNPKKFLDQLRSLMNSGDLFIFTTLSGAGLDIQVLWEDSNSVEPPHHLNFFNPKAIGNLLMRLGFELLEITTPGKLDIDILFNNQQKIKDRFWRHFISSATEIQKNQMQEIIASSGNSSHMMIVCKKP